MTMVADHFLRRLFCCVIILLNLNTAFSMEPLDPGAFANGKPGYVIEDVELGSVLVKHPVDHSQIDLESIASGPGLEGLGALLIPVDELPEGNSLTAEAIMHTVVQALEKQPDGRSALECSCIRTLQMSIGALAQQLPPYLSMGSRLVIFGGVALGEGNLYQFLLQGELTRQRIWATVFPSPLGDERAIIGAVAYAVGRHVVAEIQKPCALGIDLGGTSVRVGKVEIATNRLVGDIIAGPIFSEHKNIRTMRYMRYLSSKIKGKTQAWNLSQLPDIISIGHVLNGSDCALHGQLQADLLNQLVTLIKRFDLIDVAYISIAQPGIYDEESGFIKLAYNVPLTGCNLCDALHREFPQLEVIITSDVGCAGIGELIYGAGRGSSDIFVLGVGTGLNLCHVLVSSDGSPSAVKRSRGCSPLPCFPPGFFQRGGLHSSGVMRVGPSCPRSAGMGSMVSLDGILEFPPSTVNSFHCDGSPTIDRQSPWS